MNGVVYPTQNSNFIINSSQLQEYTPIIYIADSQHFSAMVQSTVESGL